MLHELACAIVATCAPIQVSGADDGGGSISAVQQAYLKASNTDIGDGFGSRIDVYGDTVVVAAVGEESTATGVNGNQQDDSAQYSGAAYVFVRDGAKWRQQAYLKASNTDPAPFSGAGDMFGTSVAIWGDTIVVGAAQEDSDATGVNGAQFNDDAEASGAVYVFVRQGSTWTQQAYLKASNTDEFDLFGTSVDIHGDTIVVGAIFEDSAASGVDGNQLDDSLSTAGAAYVFTRSGTTWSQQAYLKASSPGQSDRFGAAVAVSGDTVAVVADGEDSSATGIDGNQADNGAGASGAVYVFTRSGTTWSQQAYVKASNTATDDFFGSALALDGDTLAVGARGEDGAATGIDGDQASNGALESGAAYVYVRNAGTWTQQAYVKASNTEAGDNFGGGSIGLSGDVLVVTAASEDSSATGANGDQASNAAIDSGAAYVFGRSGSVWTQDVYLKASNTQTNDFLAFAALHGDTVVVGTGSEDSSATGINGDQSDDGAPNSGAAYVQVLCSGSTAAAELVRVGSPPNPAALLPGVTGAPVLGTTWQPVVDHTTFMPAAALDVLTLALVPANFVAAPYGTVLCTGSVLSYVAAPGSPFAVAIPADCSIAGVALCTQGASWNGSLPATDAGNVLLTNALDITLGSF